MTFVDVLRSARASRVSILHEFLSQYDPRQKRVHAFFEGHDDTVLFRPFVERLLPKGSRLYIYRCDGKPKVYGTYEDILQKVPDAKSILFFVDKDIDDVLGTPWPTDPRIFVTDTYSIENYVVCSDTLRRLYRDCIKLTGISFSEDDMLDHFEAQLKRFHFSMIVVMAWIVAVRRAGLRPNLSNLNLKSFMSLTDVCEIRNHRGERLAALHRATGVATIPGIGRKVSSVSAELRRLPPKRFIRGKFEAWFFVEFWKKLQAQLKLLAIEAGGKAVTKITVEHTTFAIDLARYVDCPPGLERFLCAHLREMEVPEGGASTDRQGWREALKRLLFRR